MFEALVRRTFFYSVVAESFYLFNWKFHVAIIPKFYLVSEQSFHFQNWVNLGSLHLSLSLSPNSEAESLRSKKVWEDFVERERERKEFLLQNLA